MYGILLIIIIIIIIKVHMHQIKIANVILIVETSAFVKLHGLISYHLIDEIEKFYINIFLVWVSSVIYKYA